MVAQVVEEGNMHERIYYNGRQLILVSDKTFVT